MEPTRDNSDMLGYFKNYYNIEANSFGLTFVAGTVAGAVFHSIAEFKKADGCVPNKLKQSLLRVGRRAPVWGGLLTAVNLLETFFAAPYYCVTKSEKASPAMFGLTLAAFNYRGGPAKMLGYGVMGSAIGYAINAADKKLDNWEPPNKPMDVAAN